MRHAYLRQCSFDRLVVDILVAAVVHIGNCGPFRHYDNQDIIFAPNLDILKETGSKERFDRFIEKRVIGHIADLYRQIVKYCADLDIFRPFDANIIHDKIGGGW